MLQADARTDGLPADAASREGNAMLPYQREGVDFALRRGGRVLLGDEMGLGKTAQALVLASQYPQDWPLLVVCPSSLRGNWREEASRWIPRQLLPDPERDVQVVRAGADKLRKEARVIIVSYDLVKNPQFSVSPSGADYRIVICDEAHYLKTPSAQRTQAVRTIVQMARRCALLTGTPALAKAAELYSPLDCLLPGLLPSHKEFCQRYCNEKQVWQGRRHVSQWDGSRLGDEMNALLSTVMIRRMKNEVLTQLPSKRRQRIVLEKLSGDKDVLKDLNEKMRNFKGREAEALSEASGGGGAPELFRLTGLAKKEAVADYVEYLVLADCKFLLFAHHQDVLDHMQQKLEKLKTGFIRIDGKTPSQKREDLVNEFRSKPEKQVAILSITACGQGLNLQVCSTVVFAELHWTPGMLQQAEDRVHRMGQKNCVNVHYLIAKDTLDDSLYSMLERKHQDVGQLLDGQRSHLGAAQAPAGQVGAFTTSDDPSLEHDPPKAPPPIKLPPGQQTLNFNVGKGNEKQDTSSGENEAALDDGLLELLEQAQEPETVILASQEEKGDIGTEPPPSAIDVD
mmetsp:Transcript_76152/g.134442  ORF Transcript_76152/g.134442 Transcript_76152/m.134442 type:complete len:568 (-) Transcript_76152:100-1803(-)